MTRTGSSAFLVAVFLAACSSSPRGSDAPDPGGADLPPDAVNDLLAPDGETADPGLDALEAGSDGDATVALDAMDLAAETPDVTETGPDTRDAALEDPTGVSDVSADLQAELPVDASAEFPADLPVDANIDMAADAPSLPLWEDLTGSGLPLNQIAGIASQMDTRAPVNADRDFEYAQYQPYPGFRMRNGHRWEDVEPRDGEWHFENVSGSVDGAKVVGSRVLMALNYAPEWAREGELLGTVHVDDFAEYAGAMAGYFCDTVKEYEVWNEENIARFWQPAADPKHYGDLLAASAVAIRAACPDARVIFGGMSSYDDVDLMDIWGFLRRTLEGRPELCDAFDGLGLHPYTWFQYDPPERDEYVSYGMTKPSQSRMVAIAQDILVEAGCGTKPAYFTEVGWPSYELSEDTVARYAARSFLLTARDGVQAWCWYTFWDNEPSSEGIRPHENYFGMFGWKGPDGSIRRAKPAWLALTTTLNLLGTHRFARDLGPALGLPNDVYVLAFTDAAGALSLALWDGREVPDVTEDGDMPGGPDTTFDLDLPLPPCTVGTRLLDQWGGTLPSPGAGPTAHLVLAPTVQYLQVDCPARK